MKFIKLINACLLMLGLLFFSCAKEEIQGPKGEPGTPGGGGNAGINASSIFTVTSTQWQKTADSAWAYSINTSLITQEIVDKGVVKVYVQIGTAWWELPYTEGDLFTQCGFDVGFANLHFADIHGGMPPRPSTAAYRVITISEVARAANPSINWGKYEEVIRLINANEISQ